MDEEIDSTADRKTEPNAERKEKGGRYKARYCERLSSWSDGWGSDENPLFSSGTDSAPECAEEIRTMKKRRKLIVPTLKRKIHENSSETDTADSSESDNEPDKKKRKKLTVHRPQHIQFRATPSTSAAEDAAVRSMPSASPAPSTTHSASTATSAAHLQRESTDSSESDNEPDKKRRKKLTVHRPQHIPFPATASTSAAEDATVHSMPSASPAPSTATSAAQLQRGWGKIGLRSATRRSNRPTGEPFFRYDKTPTESDQFYFYKRNSRSFKNANVVSEETYGVYVENPSKDSYLENMVPQLTGMFEALLQHIKEQSNPQDLFRLYIDHPVLSTAIKVYGVLKDITVSEIMEQTTFILHSAEDVPVDDNLEVDVAIAKMPSGAGYCKMLDIERDRINKRSLLTIQNSDKMCLARAIVLAKAQQMYSADRSNLQKKKDFQNVRKPFGGHQTAQALKLLVKAKLPVDVEGTIKDIPVLEKVIGVSVSLLSATASDKRVYNGVLDKNIPRVYLYHWVNAKGKGHFDVIKNVSSFLGFRNYCDLCDVAYQRKDTHVCNENNRDNHWCKLCNTKTKCQEIEKEKICCRKCNKTFPSLKCFDRHKITKPITRGKYAGKQSFSQCEKSWLCRGCNVIIETSVRKKEKHVCGEVYCKNCKLYYIWGTEHLCYMRSDNGFSNEQKRAKFIFYDFEATQDEGKHVPNLVIAQTACDDCCKKSENERNVEICENCCSRCKHCGMTNKETGEYEREPCLNEMCGKNEVVFRGVNSCNEFCKWIFTPYHKNFTVIAHNAKAYDLHFVFDYCVRNQLKPKIILNGSKIMYMTVQNIRFLDSLNFLPMGLGKIPKALGLSELKKGYFPHFFNCEENQNAVLDHLPDVKFYGVDSMLPEARDAFLKWHGENRNTKFVFEEEIETYCRSDVDILRRGCMTFKSLIEKLTGVNVTSINPETFELVTEFVNAINPFTYTTLASLCMGIFRRKFLPEKWKVLERYFAKQNPECLHELYCKCEWTEGRKLTADSEIEAVDRHKSESYHTFNPLEHVKREFESSPISLLPPGGYGRKDKQSVEALLWLKRKEKQINANLPKDVPPITIQTAVSSPEGEKCILYQNLEHLGVSEVRRYKVDGYFKHPVTSEEIVLEYYGCHMHGCPKCYKINRTTRRIAKMSVHDRFTKTKIREKHIREMGFKVITKWSCEFAKEKGGRELSEWEKESVIPIDIRDAYFGGRTNAIQLYYNFQEGETGKYIDFNSLYPAVMKYKPFPKGHPNILKSNFKTFIQKPCEEDDCYFHHEDGNHKYFPYFGIAKVKILPPQNLIHPVLPFRANGKLMFPLCKTCAINENHFSKCTHSKSERAFTQTWVTPEIEAALNVGYKILKIYEVLHWEEKCDDLFTAYIDTFYKLKCEASGFPDCVKTEEEKVAYLERFYDVENIKLDPDNMAYNPAMRVVSKLMLNTLYGKFGQREDLKQTSYVKNADELYSELLNPNKTVLDFSIITNDLLQIDYKDVSHFRGTNTKNNVIVATFCTAWARLQLYRTMYQLGDRVLYTDTDSLIYISRPEEWDPPCGEFLGDLNDELSCAKLKCKQGDNCIGHTIKEFASGGPKHYAFVTLDNIKVCKLRGFSLNYENSVVVNASSMIQAIKDWHGHVEELRETSDGTDGCSKEISKRLENIWGEMITVNTRIGCRPGELGTLYSRKINKQYGIQYNKRQLIGNFETRPWGFIEK